jgi:hypothetical protein
MKIWVSDVYNRQALMTGIRAVLAACAVSWAALVPARAGAQEAVDDATKNAARELAYRGKAAFEHGDFAEARDLYSRAYALVPAPTLSVREARALVKLGLWVEGIEAYVRTTRTKLDAASPGAFRRAVSEAHAELARLRPRVPQLTVVVRGAHSRKVSVKMDGSVYPEALLGVARPVNPGFHQLVATTEDGQRVETRVTLAQSARQTTELVLPEGAPSEQSMPARAGLEPPQAEPRRQIPLLVYGAFGVGGLGLGVGAVTGWMASKKYSSLEQQCPDHQCAEGSSAEQKLDSFRTLRTVSTVGYVVGVLGAAAGVTLYVTLRSTEAGPVSGARLSPYVTPEQAGFVGSF